jgi:hypothetical protein
LMNSFFGFWAVSVMARLLAKFARWRHAGY